MRQITMLVLTLFCVSAFAEFKGQILTYKQLMRLPAAQRAQYVKNVRELVLELERQQLEKEKHFPKQYSAWIEDLKDFAGKFQVLPEAHAKLADDLDMKPVFTLETPPLPEVREETPSTEPPNDLRPSDPAAQPVNNEPITRGYREDEIGPEPTVTGEPPPPAAPSVTVKAQVPPTCEIPAKLECESMSKAERDAGIKSFRSDTKYSTCVSGGTFSEYPNGRKVPGGCAIISSFAGKNCPSGQAMCNPVIFGAMKYGADNQPQNFQLVCVPKSSRGQFDITNRCGLCPMKPGWEKIKDPEDFVTLVNLNRQKDGKFGAEFTNAWNELRRSLATNFKERCLQPGGKDFRAAFCQECKTIGQRISEMNIAVLKTACAGNLDEVRPEKTSRPPSGESGGATREPSSRKVN